MVHLCQLKENKTLGRRNTINDIGFGFEHQKKVI